MVKTNSKIVIEKIRKILVDCNNFAIDCGYDFEEVTDWKEAGKNIYNAFYDEYLKNNNRYKFATSEIFYDWMSGLPTACSVSNNIFLGSAVDFLGDLLEQTSEERNRFDDRQAEKTACNIIFREIQKAL